VSDRTDLSDLLLEAIDLVGIGVSVTTDDGDAVSRVYFNEAAARIFGVTVEEAASLPPLGALTPKSRDRMMAIRQAMAAGEPAPSSLEVEIVRADGTIVPLDVSIAMVTYRGAPATVAFLRDVTDRVAIESRLRASESRFRTFAEAAPDAILVVHDSKLLYVNPAAATLLGDGRREVLNGRSLEDLLSADDLPTLHERVGRISKGEVLRPQEYRVKKPDGTTVAVEMSSIPIEFEGRSCLLAFGRDMTERKRMQSRLIQADRLATVGTLATGVAHEINNPLTYVVLHLEKLRISLTRLVPVQEDRKEAERLLSEALEGAERVRLIVKDLLALARSDTSTHGPTDVQKVVSTAIKLASPVLDGTVTVSTALEPTAPVGANAAWLGQVFVNLLVNAGQVFDQKDPENNRVTVSTRTDANGDVVVEVGDNGPGIPSDIIERIFDPFFTTKPAGSGTGLGLAISRSIIDSLGGDIAVRTAPGLGTTFRVHLPSMTRARRAEAPTIRTTLESGLRSIPPPSEREE
jgi:PAS domain S-box-containing protein